MRRSSLLLAVSFISLATAMPTIASAQDSAQPLASTAAPATAVGDIVVTARRREENLQDVPISVSALSSATLERANVKSALDLQYQTPSLSVTTNAYDRSNLSFSLRGQRTNESQLLTDPPVGTYFAEVVQPRPYGFGRSLYDLSSVQVLKGVQGTLFGRNVTGGAVLIEPQRPTSKFEAEIKGQVGNFDLRETSGMLNLPLGDIGALRVAAIYHKRDGYTKDIGNGRDYDDENYHSFRIGLTLRPFAGFENYTLVDYYKSNEHGTGNYLTSYTPIQLDTAGNQVRVNGATVSTVLGQFEGARRFGGPGFTPLPLTNFPAAFAAAQALQLNGRLVDYGAGDGGRLDALNSQPYSRQKNVGITNKTTLDLGGVTLKNIASYRKIDYDRLYDLDGSPAFIINSIQFTHVKQYSEELQLQGNLLDKRLSYTFGGYYFLEKGLDGATSSQFPELTLLGFARAGVPINPFTAPATLGLLNQPGRGRSETYAVYGAGTYKLTDQLSFAGGLRYTNDRRDITVTPRRPNFPTAAGSCTFNPTPVPGGEVVRSLGSCAYANGKSWNALTWDATLSFEPSDAVNMYGSVRRGFRSGGFGLRAQSALELQSFDPEHVTEYELGLKTSSRFGSGRLRSSFALFYQDYKNVQKQNPVLVNGVVATIVTNTAAQENYGGEAEVGFNFDNGLYGNLFYSYTRVRVLKGGDPLSFDQVGVPKHQGGITLGFSREVFDRTRLDLTATASFRSRQNLDDKDFSGREGGYTIINLRAGLANIAGSGFGAALFVNNATNTKYRVGVLGLMDQVGYGTSVYGTPRTYGMEASFKF